MSTAKSNSGKSTPPCYCSKTGSDITSGGVRTTHRDDIQKKALINRLRRIEGQIRGLISMLDNDAYCNDILQQSAAVSSAIHSFNQELLGAHIKGCVVDDIRKGDDAVVDELMKTIRKLMK